MSMLTPQSKTGGGNKPITNRVSSRFSKLRGISFLENRGSAVVKVQGAFNFNESDIYSSSNGNNNNTGGKRGFVLQKVTNSPISAFDNFTRGTPMSIGNKFFDQNFDLAKANSVSVDENISITKVRKIKMEKPILFKINYFEKDSLVFNSANDLIDNEKSIGRRLIGDIKTDRNASEKHSIDDPMGLTGIKVVRRESRLESKPSKLITYKNLKSSKVKDLSFVNC
jgi:hypothetical protein